MTIAFEETESTQTALWDYGWFNVTRFRVKPSCDKCLSEADVIDNLIASPIYRRSFCESPDPWGVSIDRHGPFHLQLISSEWYQRISADELSARISAAITGAGFDNQPTDDQLTQVNAWAENIRTREDAIFVMNAPDDEHLRVEWAHVWLVFTEFICVNLTRSDLTIAVIGYD